MFSGLSVPSGDKRTLRTLRWVALLAVLLLLFMIASLIGEMQAGITNVIPFFMSVVFCLAAAVIATVAPEAGGLLFIVGGIAILYGATFTDAGAVAGPFAGLIFAVPAIAFGAALVINARQVRLARAGPAL